MNQLIGIVERFKADIRQHDNTAIVDRYYYSGTGVILTSTQEAELRRKISDHFRISIRDVLIVGSAKLGFTVTNKPARPRLSPFSDTSDIDVALISPSLFVRYWEDTFAYWLDKDDWNHAGKFRNYMFRGWLRPDKLPASPDFPRSGEWFEFFRSLQASGRYGGYKIAAGIYFNEMFWENYVGSAISDCRRFVEEGI